MDVNWTYWGDHFLIYINIESCTDVLNQYNVICLLYLKWPPQSVLKASQLWRVALLCANWKQKQRRGEGSNSACWRAVCGWQEGWHTPLPLKHLPFPFSLFPLPFSGGEAWVSLGRERQELEELAQISNPPWGSCTEQGKGSLLGRTGGGSGANADHASLCLSPLLSVWP